jgi:Na+-transporting NADH:ubiquinone oxidoreductase subunit A
MSLIKNTKILTQQVFSVDMKIIQTSKGLDIPISGRPEQKIRQSNQVRKVALVGDDYIGMRPTMLVGEGDRVKTGQQLFIDKKNEGVTFTSPGSGIVHSINRGAKRKFESLTIELDGEESIHFSPPSPTRIEETDPEEIRTLLINSGLWTGFRTRPYGKIPGVLATPASLFITAADTSPLAADPQIIIDHYEKEYQLGLRVLQQFMPVPIHYCTGADKLLPAEELDGINYYSFQGPHPAGLPSTHIHFIDPVHEAKSVWHIGYQDVIGIGHLFATGSLSTEKIVSLAGPATLKPSLVITRPGAFLPDLCRQEITLDDLRIVSGSVLSGRESTGNLSFLGRYHDQVSVLVDSSGRSFFNWAMPGKDRFSIKPVFSSALKKHLTIPFNTALWGGKRAIFPLDTYDQVMPLDIIATSLLKALSTGDTEKSKDLGCLELIEDDVALCGFVCAGKNEFSTTLRQVLSNIELGY